MFCSHQALSKQQASQSHAVHDFPKLINLACSRIVTSERGQGQDGIQGHSAPNVAHCTQRSAAQLIGLSPFLLFICFCAFFHRILMNLSDFCVTFFMFLCFFHLISLTF